MRLDSLQLPAVTAPINRAAFARPAGCIMYPPSRVCPGAGPQVWCGSCVLATGHRQRSARAGEELMTGSRRRPTMVIVRSLLWLFTSRKRMSPKMRSRRTRRPLLERQRWVFAGVR